MLSILPILLETNPKQIIGIIVLVLFIGGAAVLGGLQGKKNQKKRDDQLNEILPKKVAGDNDWFITSEKQVVCADKRYAKLAIYEFPLEDIEYVMEVSYTNGSRQLGFYDANKKTVKAVKYASGKTSKSKAFFNPTSKHDPKVFALIKASKPSVKHVKQYFKDFDS